MDESACDVANSALGEGIDLTNNAKVSIQFLKNYDLTSFFELPFPLYFYGFLAYFINSSNDCLTDSVISHFFTTGNN